MYGLSQHKVGLNTCKHGNYTAQTGLDTCKHGKVVQYRYSFYGTQQLTNELTYLQWCWQ